MARPARKGKTPSKKKKRSSSRRPSEPAVRVKRSGIHGRGLFAEEEIAKGAWIGTYEGRRTQRDGKYVLWIWEGDEACYGIAGKNHMRFINHSARPNARFEDDQCYAIKRIRPGDEITFHYGEDWEDLD